MFRFFSLILLLFIAGEVFALDEQQLKKAIEDARVEFNKAVDQQGGWTSTEDLLKEAELNLSKGEKEKALKLANQAKHEAELSLAQSKAQQQKWAEPTYIHQ